MEPATNNYPLFAPPQKLAAKPAKQWSSMEADAYREWLVSVINIRIMGLLEYLGENYGDTDIEDILNRIGNRIVELLKQKDNEFVEQVGRETKLTKQGHALAADVGLLVAHYLIKRCGSQIRWEVLKKPKSALSFNLPVLNGFHIEFDPIAGTLGELNGILRGTRQADFLQKVFLFWSSKATEAHR
jgi:hypothetical protein